MVLVPLHHAHELVQVGVPPLGPVGQAVARARLVVVRLDVHLVVDPQPVLVGQVVEVRVGRVVRGAHGVDVEPLHQRHVLFLALARHVPAVVRVGLGAVDALEQHPLAVDQQLPVGDGDLAEADPLLGDVADPPVRAGQGEHQGVQGGGLVGPLGRIGHRRAQHQLGGVPVQLDRPAGAGHPPAAGVVQLRPRGVLPGRPVVLARHRDPRGQRGVDVVVVQVRGDRDVPQVAGGRGVEPHRAEDAGVAPLVVVLQVGAGAPAVHLHGDPVAAGVQRRGDVELRRGVAALVVADVAAVDPHEVAGGDALEAEERASTVPCGRNVEGAHVRGGRVDVPGHRRRVVRPHLAGHVAEHRVVQPVGLPGVRHRHAPPAADVVVVGEEPGRHVLGPVRHVDLPVAVQAERVGRVLLVPHGRGHVGVGPQHRVRRLLALPGHPGVLQVGVHVGPGRLFGHRRGEPQHGHGRGNRRGDTGSNTTAHAKPPKGDTVKRHITVSNRNRQSAISTTPRPLPAIRLPNPASRLCKPRELAFHAGPFG